MSGESVWIGWPGTVVPESLEPAVTKRLQRDNLVPVYLTAEEEEDFYGRVCNDTLWPLFHYFADRLRITPEAWQHYVEVNERFANAILERCGPDTRVWVHDFHLMLVPAMLRRRSPDLSVGFFLHTPFPSSEVYRLLPERESLLRGVLGSDYVSFQIGDYARHFRSSCLRVLGLDSRPDSLEVASRRVGLGVDPIGIDVEGFRSTLADAETARLYAQLEQQYEGRRLVLGVERLDYTKGIPQKLLAYERFLERDPTLALTTTMLQVLVPVPPREPRVPSAARRDRAPDRAHQRSLRAAGQHARRIPAPRHLEAGARRALPAGGRHDGDAAARRDEPRRARVRPLPDRARPGRSLAAARCSSRSSRARRRCCRGRCS